MGKDDIHRIIIKELTSEISDDEKKYLEGELSKDSEFEKRFLSFKDFWNKFYPENIPHNIISKTEQKLGFTNHKKNKFRTSFVLKIVSSILLNRALILANNSGMLNGFVT